MANPFVRTSLALMVLGLALAANRAAAQMALPDPWVTNGHLYAVETLGNTIYVGGAFTMVGPPTGAAVAMDEATGSLLQPWPKVGGTVAAVEPDGAGGWYVGGLFNVAGGATRTNLAHFDASGQVTAWSPGTNNIVQAIRRSGNTVYIGGTFTTVDGVARNRAAAVDAVTGAVLAWNPDATGFTPFPPGLTQVKAIEVNAGVVYIGGTFGAIQGAARGGFAEVDAITGAPTSWAIGADQVHALEVSGSRLYVGSGVLSAGKVRVFEMATHDSLGNPTAFSSQVNAIAVDPNSGIIYAGGQFTTAGGVTRNRLAALGSPAGGVTAWNPTASSNVMALGLSTGGLLVGGQFSTLGGLSRPFLAMVDLATGSPTGWLPRPGTTVRALAVANGIIYAGGTFSLMNGIDRNCLASFDATTRAATAWNPSPSNTVLSLFPSGNTLYVGGLFSTVAGQPRNGAAAFDASTGALTAWNPNVMRFGVAGDVRAMARVGSTLFLGGDFTQVGGVARQGLAPVDATTGALSPWSLPASGTVYVLRTTSGPSIPTTLYVGGNFSTLGPNSRNCLAAIQDPTAPTPTVTSWNPDVTGGFVTDLALLIDPAGAAAKSFAGGTFTTVGGTTHPGIAEIDPTGAMIPTNLTVSGGVVSALEFVNGTLYLGGSFTTVVTPAGDAPRAGLAAIHEGTGLLPWAPVVALGTTASTGVTSLAIGNSYLYVGGSFSSVGTSAVSNVATMIDAVTAVEADPFQFPTSALRAAPNPFGMDTTLRFSLPRAGRTLITIYDVAGRLVRRLSDGDLASGPHRIAWNGLDERACAVGSGIYIVQVRSPGSTSSAKVYRLR